MRAELADIDIRQDVDVHERSSRRLRQNHRGRRPQSSQLQGQICVPARIDDERVSQPAQAVQHDESR